MTDFAGALRVMTELEAGGRQQRTYVVKMDDGSRWAVPVAVIASNRASYYAREFGGDVRRSLVEDTLPLFDGDFFEVHDWASGNMDWADVRDFATRAEQDDVDIDFEEGWMNGEWEVV